MVMISRFSTVAASIVALAAVVSAELKVLSPGGPDLWWVADSANTLAWSCSDSPYQTFTVLIANKDPTILTQPLAIVAIQNNYDCSKTLTQQQAAQAAGTGYTVQLANPLNATEIYAESEEFEIKALGATYPTTTVGVSSASASASNTASGTAVGAATTTEAGKNTASTLKTSLGMGIAALGVVFGLVAA